MRGDDLSERLLAFAVRITRLVSSLPKNIVGRHVAGQILRCGTSGGSNYEEARGAESKADFLHKMGVSWKETREAWYWLRLIHKAELVKPKLVEQLIKEANELAAILGKSLATASGRAKKKNEESRLKFLIPNS